MTAPKVDLSTIIHYLRERCGKETYASNLERVQEFLAKHKNPPVHPHLGSEIEVEEVLCRSVLIAARRMLETPGHEHMKFLDLVHNLQMELAEWRGLGQRYYGDKADTPEALCDMIDRRLQAKESRGRT